MLINVLENALAGLHVASRRRKSRCHLFFTAGRWYFFKACFRTIHLRGTGVAWLTPKDLLHEQLVDQEYSCWFACKQELTMYILFQRYSVPDSQTTNLRRSEVFFGSGRCQHERLAI